MRRPEATRASATRLLRPALLGAGMLVLVVAVALMHSLGVGHGPMASGHARGHHPASEVVAPAASTTNPTVVNDAGPLGHSMAAMCLAVPLLPLLLRRPGLRRSMSHALASTTRRLVSPVGVGTGRSPPPTGPPLRLTLCVLRT